MEPEIYYFFLPEPSIFRLPSHLEIKQFLMIILMKVTTWGVKSVWTVLNIGSYEYNAQINKKIMASHKMVVEL